MASDLRWRMNENESTTHVALEGSITETSDFRPLLEQSKARVVLDLAGIRRINSSGVREWISFVGKLTADGREVVLERCAVPIVHQLNMISSMRGKASIRSVMLPYFCARCETEHTTVLELGEGSATFPDVKACPACGKDMEFDDLPESYLAFHK